jgi:hypothetical protein
MKRGRCGFLPRARRSREGSSSGRWRCLPPLLQGDRLWCYSAVLRPSKGAKRNHRLLVVLLDWLIGHEWKRLGVVTTTFPSRTRLASSSFSGAKNKTYSSMATSSCFPWHKLARIATKSHARSITRVQHSSMVCGWNSRPSACHLIGGLL